MSGEKSLEKLERKVDAWMVTMAAFFLYLMGAGIVDLVLWVMILVGVEMGIELLIKKINQNIR